MTHSLTSDLLNAPLTQALGEILLHSLWQSAAIAFFLLILLWWTRSEAAATRYALSYLGLVLCAVLPVVTYAMSVVRPVPMTAEPVYGEVAVADQGTPWRQASTMVGAFESGTGLATSDDEGIAVPVQPLRAPVAWHELVRSTLRWLVVGWFFGLVILMARLALGLRTTHKLRTCFVSPVSRELEVTVRRLTAQLNIKQQVSVVVSKIADVPLVIGFFKPVVLIPVGMLSGLTPRQLEMLLAHELSERAVKARRT